LPPGNAKEDWRILRALSETLKNPLPYNTLEEIRHRLRQENSVFQDCGVLAKGDLFALKTLITEDSTFKNANERFEEIVNNFYQTDPISRASQTMAACVLEHLKPKEESFEEKW